jgi:DNA polymerase-4
MIACLDLDAFFVSVERAKDPSLKGRPVIVGGDPLRGRGVVTCASYEARVFGVHAAMPSAKAKRLCPQAVFLRGDFDAYRAASQRVRALVESVSPAVEQASIDEFFLSFRGCGRLYRGDYFGTLGRLRGAIRREVGITASAGLASTRTTAKILSNLAKPDGQMAAVAGGEAALLAPLPVEAIPGVGERMKEKLNALGLATVGDLQRMPPALLQAALGSWGGVLRAKALGEGADDEAFIAPSARVKSVSAEETLEADTTDLKRLDAVLFWLVQKVAFRARQKGLWGRTLTVKIRYTDFSTVSAARTFAGPTASYPMLEAAALDLFRALYTRRVRLRLLGAELSRLEPDPRQLTLDFFGDRKGEILSHAVDTVREKHGLYAIAVGAGEARKRRPPREP